MNKVKKWNGVEGCFVIECGLVDLGYGHHGKWIDAHTEQPLPKIVAKELTAMFLGSDPEDIAAELIIKFESNGFYDPGRTYGDPYYCYPPEGEDERTIIGNVEVLEGTAKRHLSKEASDELFDIYLKKIEDVEIDCSPHEPDYEPDYE